MIIQEEQKEFNWTESFTVKLAIIGTMTLLLLIPLTMIKSIIKERENNQVEVEKTMMEQWGDAQEITGPVLHIPFYKTVIRKETEEKLVVKKWVHIMPENLTIDSNISPNTRYRGIYKTTVFHSEMNIAGHFLLDKEQLKKYGDLDYSDAVLSIGITDNRGIKGITEIKWNTTPLEIEPGLKCKDLVSQGISAQVPLIGESTNKDCDFNIKLNVSGTKSLSYCPNGKTTTIQLSSSWTDPKFTGSFLPNKRKITPEGFQAEYEITHLNRSFPQIWQEKDYAINDRTLGVELFIPNNHYQKSLRSAKYGILFIILTTLVFLFIELSKKKEIHMLQYLLVSLALVLFFSILTALSEHLGFNLAYLCASVCTIALITSYSKTLLKENQLTLWVLGLLTILYTFLFVLLQLQDYAFLAGNIGLFVILAVIMKASSKLKLNTTNQSLKIH
jgi:inner membrane protein